jgi:hypothetical protein
MRALVVLLLALASGALAQERPPEEDLFGRPEEKPSNPPPASEAKAGDEGVGQKLGATENPLAIGGVLYLRSNVSSREHTPPSQWTFTVPTLTDLYLDVRPTDRVRGFVLGRMLFDPTQGAAVSPLPGVALPSAATATLSNPRVLLDQLWLSFDVEHDAFVTAGRQHVKWGVGRFWNPTDYLHAVRRDPLAVFDQRTGTTMVRVNVPWERRGWNFSWVGIFEPLVTQPISPFLSTEGGTSAGLPATTSQQGTASQLGTIGGGARAEIVLGSWELGLDGVAQRGIRPRFGIDLSGGLWELDVRGELALRTSSDVPLYRGTLTTAAPYEPAGIRPAAVLAADWSHKYSDEDSFTVGVEYFYNSNGYGYDDRGIYPLLIVANAFTPFYLGRHYAGAFLLLPRPGSWNLHTFTLSVLANLSDRSAVARLDWNMTLLTYLTLEAYAQGHAGTNGGEFRLGIDVPANVGGSGNPAVFVGAPAADVGLALRVSL